jgi:hypothetical protein
LPPLGVPALPPFGVPAAPLVPDVPDPPRPLELVPADPPFELPLEPAEPPLPPSSPSCSEESPAHATNAESMHATDRQANVARAVVVIGSVRSQDRARPV